LAKKLTLVCAPAGFGKSTLLAEWLADGRAVGQAISHQGAWLSLDDSDNDPIRFWTYFVAALQTIHADLGLSTLVLLQSPQPPTPELLLTPLLNEVAARPEQMVLVLDDYHVINTPAIHKALLFLLDHLPPQLHLILSSRADPPWPLARWRARAQLTELRADELRFTPAEAARFLQEVMGLDLSVAAITALETRTEGWIAGLQLAALSLQGVSDREQFIAAFSGSNRYIVDYLVEEVLSQQPDEVQSFLLQTSILDRLCGPLCDTVIGHSPLAIRDLSIAERPMPNDNSQTILEYLEHANLFLIPLDIERQWYRYHHLFAEVLSNRLRQTQRAGAPALHLRASAWYEQQALWSEAIHHALAAEDFVRAARLIELVGITLFVQTNIQHSLKRWLSKLPAEIIRDRPRLCLIYAWTLSAEMDISTGFQWVAEASAALQRNPPQSDDAPIASEIAAMRAMLTAYSSNLAPSEAIAWGQQALNALSTDQTTFRCIAAGALGMAYLRLGDVTQAERALAEANRMSQAAGNVYLFIAAAANQVAMQRALGSLRLALATCQETLAWVTQRSALVYPTVGGLYLNLADLLREQNKLGAALRYAEEAVNHSSQEVNPALFIFSRLVLMRIKQAQGEWAQAWTLLRQISALVEQHPAVIHRALLPAIAAQFQVMEGIPAHNSDPGLTAAMAWAQGVTWEEGELLAAYRFFDFIYQYEHSRIARAQVFIAWGRSTGDSSLLHETFIYLERQWQIAEAGSLPWHQIKVYLLQALAHQALGDAASAQIALTQALGLAQPEGYVRVFLDEGEPLRLLMTDCRLRMARLPPHQQQLHLIAYIDTLLPAFGAVQEVQGSSPSQQRAPVLNLVEPLTERELEILRLVNSGLSNNEIAGQMIVTVGTVKKHLNNIFGKLGVSSRTQALVCARGLNLL
jgi:LuxR family maltose regulon positive regulatory protein